MPDLRRTPLYARHVDAGGRMVDFAGWQMPVQYPSGTLAEHRAVREAVGVFDVSHMGRIAVEGPEAGAFLDGLITSDVRGMGAGRARYGLLCAEDGGVLDDLVTLRTGGDTYTVVCNAASWDRVTAWFRDRARAGAAVRPEQETTAMIAVQGPGAAAAVRSVCGTGADGLRRFRAARVDLPGAGPATVSRTGYTGEDGYELIVESSAAPAVWDRLVGEAGAAPCGLGARDTLRLEAGLLLYGQDMDATTTPLEAGLRQFVDLDKDFIGCAALREQAAAGVPRTLAGFVSEGRSAPRHGYAVIDPADGRQVGVVTSGGPSPTLGKGIGLAYLPPAYADAGTAVDIDIRGRRARAEIVETPFYRRKS